MRRQSRISRHHRICGHFEAELWPIPARARSESRATRPPVQSDLDELRRSAHALGSTALAMKPPSRLAPIQRDAETGLHAVLVSSDAPSRTAHLRRSARPSGCRLQSIVRSLHAVAHPAYRSTFQDSSLLPLLCHSALFRHFSADGKCQSRPELAIYVAYRSTT